MDKEYIENIMGSPYIREGAFSNLKTKAAQAVKNLWSKDNNSHPPIITSYQNSEEEDLNKDFSEIVLRSEQIIIDTIKSDWVHSEPFFNGELPTKYRQGIITRENVEPTPHPNAHSKTNITPSQDSNDEEEIEGEFLYNFRSRYRKALHFSIEMKPSNSNLKKIELSSGFYKIEVWWQNRDSQNNIYVVITSIMNGQSTQSRIMSFFDHEVSPYMGATTKGNSNQFSIEKIIDQSNPNSANKLSSDPVLFTEIKKLEDTFLRSLYAVVYRKAMEFKAKKKGTISLKIIDDKNDPNYGSVIRVGKNKQKEIISSKKLQDLINSTDPKEQETWIKSLEHAGYFDIFPSLKPFPPEEHQAFQDTVMSLMKLNYKEAESIKLVKDAWIKLQTVDKIPAKDITFQMLFPLATNPGQAAISATTINKPSEPKKEEPKTVSSVSSNQPISDEGSEWIAKELPGEKIEFTNTKNGQKYPLGKNIVIKIINGEVDGGSLTKDVVLASLEKSGYLKNHPDFLGGTSSPEQKESPTDSNVEKNETGEIYKDDDGTIHWINPKNGEDKPLTDKQIVQYMSSSIKFLNAIKSAGFADKYKDAVEQAILAKKQKNLKEEWINPFRGENFL